MFDTIWVSFCKTKAFSCCVLLTSLTRNCLCLRSTVLFVEKYVNWKVDPFPLFWQIRWKFERTFFLTPIIPNTIGSLWYAYRKLSFSRPRRSVVPVSFTMVNDCLFALLINNHSFGLLKNQWCWVMADLDDWLRCAKVNCVLNWVFTSYCLW